MKFPQQLGNLIDIEARMKQVNCSGTPYEVSHSNNHLKQKLKVGSIQIGLQHGQIAEAEIRRALTFYKRLFETTAKMQWSDVLKTADQFTEYLRQDWPAFYEEIKGMLMECATLR